MPDDITPDPFYQMHHMARELAALCRKTIDERDQLRAEVERLRLVVAERDQTIEDLAIGTTR